MYIIPAIDILNGKVVKLREGDYNQVTEYKVSLPEMLEQFSSNGTDFVQIIDLNGAKGDFSNQKFVLDALKKSKIKVQYGGGVRSIDKVKELIDLGFHRIIIGTQAITDEHFLEKLSKEICGKESCSDQVIIALDVLDGVIMHSGWVEASTLKPEDYIDKCTSLGYFRFLCTDISKDGRLEGSGIELYKQLKERSPFIKIIASGGISSMKDIEALNEVKVEAAVVGKAIYEGKISINDIKEWNLQALVNF
jgi:phosphoribosylformimino-5-aminoimidazole carboxamide ribotide isomerase